MSLEQIALMQCHLLHLGVLSTPAACISSRIIGCDQKHACQLGLAHGGSANRVDKKGDTTSGCLQLLKMIAWLWLDPSWLKLKSTLTMTTASPYKILKSLPLQNREWYCLSSPSTLSKLVNVRLPEVVMGGQKTSVGQSQTFIFVAVAIRQAVSLGNCRNAKLFRHS